jgi:pyruvate-formate lyase-activating enzyme
MTSIRESIRRRFAPVKPLPAGTYHYQAPQEDPRNYRLHLRLEPDGNGLLIVNAATILHLNATAAEFAYHLVKQTPDEAVASNISKRYRINQVRALQDYHTFVEQIETLIETPDLDPVSFLGMERQDPYSGPISAPYRIDCALTYQLPDSVDPNTAPQGRVTRELSTDEWKHALDKTWQAGIPHVIFTGGEPTLREDLIELVKHVEHNGQVTGLLTEGSRLEDSGYFSDLLATGLDHLLILYQPGRRTFWENLHQILKEDIFTAVHITMTPENRIDVPATIERLAEMGVPAISLSEVSPGLSVELQAARELAASLNLTLVWDLPVPYSALNPVSLEVGEEDAPSGAGRAWLYVEPDGDVLAGQGINRALGNLVTDPWESIWRPD